MLNRSYSRGWWAEKRMPIGRNPFQGMPIDGPLCAFFELPRLLSIDA